MTRMQHPRRQSLGRLQFPQYVAGSGPGSQGSAGCGNYFVIFSSSGMGPYYPAGHSEPAEGETAAAPE